MIDITSETVSQIALVTGQGVGSIMPLIGFVVSIPLAFYIGRRIIQYIMYVKRW